MRRSLCLSILIVLACAAPGFGTWVRQTSGTTNNLRDIWFRRPPSPRGWAVGDQGTILTTQNMGTNWTGQTSPTNQILYGVAWELRCLSSKEWATAVGGDTGGGAVIHTTNSGNTWITKITPTNIVYAVSYGDSMNGWGVGGAGSVWRTTDGGLTWAFQTTTLRVTWFGVWFVNDRLGWKCGTNGAIMRTTNGGADWQTQGSGVSDTLRGICFRDTLLGCVVGNGGIVLRTTDGGSSWTLVSTGFTENLHGVFLSCYGSLGYAVGANGRILATSNGGATWLPELSGVTNTLRGVWCWLDLPGYWGVAVGDLGTILYQFIPTAIEERNDPRSTVHDVRLKIQPNPFRNRCEIRYTMHDTRSGKEMPGLRIYDATGRLVKSLPITDYRLPVTIRWDGRDDQGIGLAPGVYFVQPQDGRSSPLRIMKVR